MGQPWLEKPNAYLARPAFPRRQGFGPAHEVTAAGGGRTVVGDQVAKGERKALWRDNETGAWCEFPPNDLSYFRTPGADSIFATGFQSRMRPRGGTYMKPIWPSPQFEDVCVVISILPTDVLTNPAPSPPAPPQPAPTKKRKQAAPPRGRPADYDLDAICEAAETFIREIGLPNTCEHADGESDRCPRRQGHPGSGPNSATATGDADLQACEEKTPAG